MDRKELEKKLENEGIYIFSQDEIEKLLKSNRKLNYDFIIFDDKTEIENIIIKNNKNNEDNKGNKDNKSNKEINWKLLEKLPSRIIVKGKKPQDTSNILEKRIAFDENIKLPNNTKSETIEGFKTQLYGIWIKHLLELKDKDEKLYYDSKNEDSSSDIKGFLISNIEFVRNVLEGNEVKLKDNIEEILKNTEEDTIPNIIDDIKQNRTDDTDLSVKIIKITKNFFQKEQSVPKIYESISTQQTKNEVGSSKDALIYYKRHGKIEYNDNDIYPAKAEEKERYYAEALSGSTISFSIMNNLMNKNKELAKKLLIENGLYRILIADERMAKFVDRDKAFHDSLKCAGIDIIGSLDGLEINNRPITYKFYEQGNLPSYNDVKNKQYDIFIIHQGILDKVLINNKKLTRIEIEKSVIEWKQEIPYIFITSGRGKSADIAKTAKFLPFSIIEHTLMTKPHEKFILTRILMRV